jgi:hypothetical protein
MNGEVRQMRDAATVLEIICQRGKRGLPLERPNGACSTGTCTCLREDLPQRGCDDPRRASFAFHVDTPKIIDLHKVPHRSPWTILERPWDDLTPCGRSGKTAHLHGSSAEGSGPRQEHPDAASRSSRRWDVMILMATIRANHV